MDELAAQILEKADATTLVVFCSDHGLEDGGHRDQAFYSSNAELEDPITLTNIMDKAIEKVDLSRSEGLEKIDI